MQIQIITDLISKVLMRCHDATVEDEILTHVIDIANENNIKCNPHLITKLVLLNKSIPYEVIIVLMALAQHILPIK